MAVCAGFLVQPSLGYYYAVVLPIPLLLLLRHRRSDAVLAALASCVVSIVSPAIAAVAVAAQLILRTRGPATHAPAAVLAAEAS